MSGQNPYKNSEMVPKEKILSLFLLNKKILSTIFLF